ncbi:MAG: hypothetical protein JNJ54_24130 [Myxococcaceae bacterium]|nr:hypothetical protein [Myxococcaceae bacterium]
MSVLPAPLKPWAAQLGLLQRELALALAPWIQRLSLSIGPLSDAQARPTGAPDGYDGVARKGPYERLLMTEWLYADEAPEEFLRRAAEGEHLFSRLAVREPHRARQCLVLFDSGPAQLGAPRIAHLAAFIVFASRCEAAHARLRWGVLQTPPVNLREGFSKTEAETLLRSRTTRPASSADLDGWLVSIGDEADDVWVVGSPGLVTSATSSRVQQVELDEVMTPGARRLEATVRRAGRVRQTVRLELPSAAVCTSLLRAPFTVERPKPKPVTSSPTRGLVFSASGNRLFTRGADGELISLVLPYGTSGTSKRIVFQPPPLERVIAAGWHKGLVAVTARFDSSGRVLRFVAWPLTKRGERKGDPATFEVPEALSTAPLPDDALSDLATLTFAGKRRLVLVVNERAYMLMDGLVRQSPYRVLAHTQRSERMLLLTIDEELRRAVRTTFSNGTETTTLLEGLGTTRAHFAGGMRYPLPLLGLGELATSPRWTLIDATRPSIGLDVPTGTTVVGVTGPAEWVAGLLVLTADRKRLQHVSAQGLQQIVESDSPIIEVTPDFEFPRVAWLDANGGIGVFDAANTKKLLIGLPDGNGRRLMHFTEYRR